MPQINIEVANDDFWMQELDGLHKDTLKNIKTQTKRCAYLIGARFRVYPAKPATSTYIRTGGLGDSVEVKESTSGAVLSIDPVSPTGIHYGPYVIGDANGQRQAWMHKNRWPLLKVVADKEKEKMFDGAVAQMEADIRERGIG